jgi:hypothetical protein
MNSHGLDAEAERRADRRYSVSLRVGLMREESEEVGAEVTDLGAGGCFVESGVQVSEGELVKLRFDLPSHGELTVWGHVIFWVRDTGFGVRFAPFSQGGAREKLLDLPGGAP